MSQQNNTLHIAIIMCDPIESEEEEMDCTLKYSTSQCYLSKCFVENVHITINDVGPVTIYKYVRRNYNFISK